MSLPEIGHRITEQLKKTVSSYIIPDFTRTSATPTRIPEIPEFREASSFLLKDPRLQNEWLSITTSIKNGKFEFLGVEWPQSITEKRWALDPKTGKYWPNSEYCFNIKYRHNNAMGDVKYVWELNRLQYLQPVAALSAATSDTNLALYCANNIENWIDNNPPFKGINWNSGIELSCRVVSIIIVISLIGANAFTPAQQKKINSTLAAHGYWLHRFPSKFSSANNHLIAEAGGLFLLGTLAPWLKGSSEWHKYGRETLINEARKQIYDDGVGAEQSPTYLAFSVEWLLLCTHVANKVGQPFPSSFTNRLESSGVYLRWITDDHGNQPRIGDDDEGRVVYSQSTPESYVTSILGCISSLTKQINLSPPVSTPHLREALFGRTPPNRKFNYGAKCFKTGGYSVYRGEHNDSDVMLAFDHGPLGYLSIAAHGHADALSIWLHIDGIPVIVDAGTYLYHSGEHWRDHMRGTLAHNTLSINNSDSSQISGSFNWSGKAKTELEAFEELNNGVCIKAVHHGYQRRYGISHQREVLYEEGNILITDYLIGTEAMVEVNIGFLFHPDLSISERNNSWIIYKNDRQLLKVQCLNENITGEVHTGGNGNKMGWYSGAFSKKSPAPKLVFFGSLPTSQPSKISLTLLPQD